MRLSTVILITVLLLVGILPLYHFAILETSRQSVDPLYAGKKQSLELQSASLPSSATADAKQRNFGMSDDGTRLLYAEEQSGRTMLYLWEDGSGAEKLSPELLFLESAALDRSGDSAVFLASQEAKFYSLFFWEKGFQAQELFSESLEGSWGLSFSGDGSRVVLTPLESYSRVREDGEKDAPGWSPGDSLVIDFLPRTADEQHPNQGAKIAKREFRVRFVRLEPKTSYVSVADSAEIRSWNEKNNREIKALAANRKFTRNDIDGDGADDLLLFKQNAELPIWSAMGLAGRDGPTNEKTSLDSTYVTWRVGDGVGIPVPADYNGDGVLDLATYTPRYATEEVRSAGNWQIFLSERPNLVANGALMPTASRFLVSWGIGDMIPVPADYDGDGATDIATWSPRSGYWHLLYSRGGFDVTKALQEKSRFGAKLALGKAGDLPVPADFDGNGQVDPAVSGVSSSGERTWAIYFLGSSRRDKVKEFQFGLPDDVPFAADFNCDGDAEAGVYRPGEGAWYVRFAENRIERLAWGVEGAYPILGDFDGDNCTDFAFYSPATIHKWYLMSSRFKDGVFQFFPAGRTAITAFTWGGIAEALPPQIWQRNFAAQ